MPERPASAFSPAWPSRAARSLPGNSEPDLPAPTVTWPCRTAEIRIPREHSPCDFGIRSHGPHTSSAQPQLPAPPARSRQSCRRHAGPSAIAGLIAGSRRDPPGCNGTCRLCLLGHVLKCRFVHLAEFDCGHLGSEQFGCRHGHQGQRRDGAGVVQWAHRVPPDDRHCQELHLHGLVRSTVAADDRASGDGAKGRRRVVRHAEHHHPVRRDHPGHLQR